MRVENQVATMDEYFIIWSDNASDVSQSAEFPKSGWNANDLMLRIPLLEQPEPAHELSLVTQVTMHWSGEEEYMRRIRIRYHFS